MSMNNKYKHLIEDIAIVIVGLVVSILLLPRDGNSIVISGIFISVILGSLVYVIQEHPAGLRNSAKIGAAMLLAIVIIGIALSIYVGYPKSILYSTAILLVGSLTYFSYARSLQH